MNPFKQTTTSDPPEWKEMMKPGAIGEVLASTDIPDPTYLAGSQYGTFYPVFLTFCREDSDVWKWNKSVLSVWCYRHQTFGLIYRREPGLCSSFGKYISNLSFLLSTWTSASLTDKQQPVYINVNLEKRIYDFSFFSPHL